MNVNKKGMTLLELLVSVVLISVIMLFMYKLISDVRNEKEENDRLTNNLVKISEIEAKLQEIIINYNLNQVSNGSKYMVFNIKRNTVSHNVATLSFGEGGSIELVIDSNLSGIKKETVKWSLEDAEFESVCYEINENKDLANYKIYLSNNNLIEIPIYFDAELSISRDECPNNE